METRNAKIESTFLGVDDHGIMTFWLNLDYGGSGQGAGGWCLDEYKKKIDKRGGGARSMELIMRILSTVGVDTWEELPGKYIKAKCDMGKVYGICSALGDKWLMFDDFFKEVSE